MNISGRISGVFRTVAFWAGLGVAVLAIILAGIGFLVAACYIFLMTKMARAEAAAVTGTGLLVFAVIVLLVGGAAIRKSRKRYPSLISEFGGTIGMAGRLVGLMVRKDPKKALVLSVIAGALAEYIAGEKKK